MRLSLTDLAGAKENLLGRDLIEKDGHSNRLWRGPINEVDIVGDNATFGRVWTALSFDGGDSWRSCGPVPAGVINPSISGDLNGEINFSIPGISWKICPPGDNIPQPTM